MTMSLLPILSTLTPRPSRLPRYTVTMPTYRLLIEYDGSKFAGWQVQAQGRTVQGVLLDGAARSLPASARSTSRAPAAPTPACTRSARWPRCAAAAGSSRAARWRRSSAHCRPISLCCGSTEATRSFHARHDAIARSYRYQLARRRSAFGKRFTWWVGDLDGAAMKVAAAAFVGRHDFAALAKRAQDADSTIVEVERCEVADVGRPRRAPDRRQPLPLEPGAQDGRRPGRDRPRRGAARRGCGLARRRRHAAGAGSARGRPFPRGGALPRRSLGAAAARPARGAAGAAASAVVLRFPENGGDTGHGFRPHQAADRRVRPRARRGRDGGVRRTAHGRPGHAGMAGAAGDGGRVAGRRSPRSVRGAASSPIRCSSTPPPAPTAPSCRRAAR